MVVVQKFHALLGIVAVPGNLRVCHCGSARRRTAQVMAANPQSATLPCSNVIAAGLRRRGADDVGGVKVVGRALGTGRMPDPAVYGEGPKALPVPCKGEVLDSRQSLPGLTNALAIETPYTVPGIRSMMLVPGEPYAQGPAPESPASASVILCEDCREKDVLVLPAAPACVKPNIAVFETVVSSKTHLLPVTIPMLFAVWSGLTIVECITNPGYFKATPIGACEMTSEFAIIELVSTVTAACDVH